MQLSAGLHRGETAYAAASSQLWLAATADLLGTAEILFAYGSSSGTSSLSSASEGPSTGGSSTALQSNDPRTLLFSGPLLPSSLQLFAELLQQHLRALQEAAAERAARTAAAANPHAAAMQDGKRNLECIGTSYDRVTNYLKL